jgi:hypothetical protein
MREGEGGACAALHWAWERASSMLLMLSWMYTQGGFNWMYEFGMWFF